MVRCEDPTFGEGGGTIIDVPNIGTPTFWVLTSAPSLFRKITLHLLTSPSIVCKAECFCPHLVSLSWLMSRTWRFLLVTFLARIVVANKQDYLPWCWCVAYPFWDLSSLTRRAATNRITEKRQLASVLHELNSFSLFAFHGIFHQTRVRQLDMVENT